MALSIPTVKRLFALSGNQCAFPGCTEILVDKAGLLLGEVCHICGDKPGAKRYDPAQTEVERQSFSNLIVLCANHHTIIDRDEITYTVSVLQRMKEKHESKVTKKFVISDKTARDIMMVLAGSAATYGIRDLINDLGSLVGTLRREIGVEKREERKGPRKGKRSDAAEDALKDLVEALKVCPEKG